VVEIDEVAVAGGSAGALSALAFAIRHPDRCAALLPLVPASYVPRTTPVQSVPPDQMQMAMTVLRSDFLFWVAITTMPDLMTEAMDKKVVLVTPTTLFALCKAVAYGWRVEEQAANAAKIATLGKELYKRLSVMGGHAAAMGKALDTAVGKYNAFVGSLETQVMTQARRFEELQVDHEGKELPELTAVDSGVRPLAKLASSGEDEAA
jgi:pimeloyl-ACP methyl ester carboxylesterase